MISRLARKYQISVVIYKAHSERLYWRRVPTALSHHR
jgi:hypothetical protein